MSQTLTFRKRWGHDLLFSMELPGIDPLYPFTIQTERIWLDTSDLANLLRRSVFELGEWKCYAFFWHVTVLFEQKRIVAEGLGSTLQHLTGLHVARFCRICNDDGILQVSMPSPESLVRFSTEEVGKYKTFLLHHTTYEAG